jgi:hypothetical protein
MTASFPSSSRLDQSQQNTHSLLRALLQGVQRREAAHAADAAAADAAAPPFLGWMLLLAGCRWWRLPMCVCVVGGGSGSEIVNRDSPISAAATAAGGQTHTQEDVWVAWLTSGCMH